MTMRPRFEIIESGNSNRSAEAFCRRWVTGPDARGHDSFDIVLTGCV